MTKRIGIQSAQLHVVQDPAAHKRDLVDRLLRQDADAMLALYEQFAQRVNRLVWRLLGTDQEHDDVVSQTFVNTLATIKNLRDPNALEGWIVRITINTVRKELRRRRYRRLVQPVCDVPEQLDEGVTPEEIEHARHFYDVLRDMPDNLRIVFALHYVDGLTLQQIAESCGCSLATAKRRMAKAKRIYENRAADDAVLNPRGKGVPSDDK